MDDNLRAELIEWQARCGDLQNSVERLREERDAARSSVDLLMHENDALETKLREATALVGRLTIALQTGDGA